MTPDKVKQVAHQISEIIRRKTGIVFASRFDHKKTRTEAIQYTILNHAQFMCDEIKLYVDQGRIEKAMRWLGFLQGILFCEDLCTIGELGQMNRPVDDQE